MQLHTFLQGLSASGRASFQALRWALVIGSAAALVACGGGSGGGAGGPPDVGDPGAPAAPSGLSLGAPAIKTLNFQWTAVEGATHYKLLEDLDGAGTASSPTEVTASIAGTQFGHEVPLYARLNASYTVKACNALGCSASSAPYTLQVADLNAAIGYAKATGGGVAGDGYGRAIALSKDGHTLAVGAPGEDTDAANSGAVYVMRRTAAGVWMPLPMLKDNVPEVSEFFGRSLALSADGQVLAVGVPQGVQSLSDGGTGTLGHVQMFTLNADQLGYTAGDTVKATTGAVGDWFGHTVALDSTGNVLAVGVHLSVPYSAPGAVHIYTRNGDAWVDEQIITASNGEGNDSFGYAIALSGDGKTLAVGAPYEDSGAAGIGDAGDPGTDNDDLTTAGAVYVFRRAGTAAADLFANPTYIKASNPGAGDLFGYSVALSDDGAALAVGAIQEDSNGTGVGANQANDLAFNSGAVYLFVRSEVGAWVQEAYVKASNTTENSLFGVAVALSSDGNMLAVGARDEFRTGVGINAEPNESVGAVNLGAVYVFKRSAGVWSQTAYLKSPSQSSSASIFGQAVAISGDGSSLAVGNSGENHQAPAADYPIVGAPESDNGLATDSGAVYIF